VTISWSPKNVSARRRIGGSESWYSIIKPFIACCLLEVDPLESFPISRRR
jgi:hypothetical protein